MGYTSIADIMGLSSFSHRSWCHWKAHMWLPISH